MRGKDDCENMDAPRNKLEYSICKFLSTRELELETGALGFILSGMGVDYTVKLMGCEFFTIPFYVHEAQRKLWVICSCED